MLQFIARRSIAALVTVWIATLAAVLLIHLVPGDPVRTMFAQSQGVTPAQIEEIRHNFGLDLPIYQQYFNYLVRLFHGDMGVTIRGQQPVLKLIMICLPYTLALTCSAMVVALLFGMTCGFIAAYKRGSWFDSALMVTAILGVSLPHFWLGLMLMLLFSVKWGLLPVAGTGFEGLILPALTLGITNAAIIARLTRSSMIEIFSQDFIRTARAKGLPRTLVLYRHALRAGLIPVITMMGMQFTYLMGGAVIIENVFSWNGIGRLAVQAIFQRDYPLIQGFILVFAFIVAIVSLLLDILYAWLDPRIKVQ
ncbi:glutathione ABC transporter permease [Erwinia typographi]|uniref:Glutathione ABC transporter permease n=1 Tax=Erwinia typographi TaxID=371042 RepID=A0A0A3Z6B3_9GAMM|nr:ABC transporter permease [Erwinia typographi]KGT94607.1 glutathione ABC transporter permease [Erwinia typographi]